MPASKKLEEPKDRAKKIEETATSTVTPVIEGGDPIPQPTFEGAEGLATFLAQSQGVRKPNQIQLRSTIAISYLSLAEMIMAGAAYLKGNDDGE